MDPVERQFAEAIAGAMRHPGREAVAYSEADRRTLTKAADRLRARAARLELIGEQEERGE